MRDRASPRFGPGARPASDRGQGPRRGSRPGRARALYLDLTGQTVVPGEARAGRKWVVENFDAVSSLTYLRDRKTGFWEWVRSFRGVEEASWFARDDLAPFVAMLSFSLQWKLKQMSTIA